MTIKNKKQALPKETLPKKTKKKKRKIRRVVIYGLIGVILFSLFGLWQVYQLTEYSFVYQPHAAMSKKGIPTFLAIAEANIFLVVKETTLQNGIWGVANDGVSHIQTSGRPGDNSTVIMYGSNETSQLGSILSVIPGEKIVVSTADGKTYTYLVSQTTVVSPANTAIFTKQHGETLILYTPYGFANLERFVVVAKPV